jgi:hypothetical protein
MKVRDTIWALVAVLVLCATIVHAQDQKQDPLTASPISPLPPIDLGKSGRSGKAPIGAARGVSAANDPQPYDPAQVLPDDNTLAGAQQFGLGLDHAHNIFDPSISFSELGQTVPPSPGQSSLASTTLLNGIMNFDRTWSKYQLIAAYNGGETFNLGPFSLHTSFQDLSVTQQIIWERWHLLIRDDFVASPGASFTGTGMGGPGLIAQSSSLLGSLLNGSGQVFTPGETIQTGNAIRYMNSVLGQAEYSFSRRSSFTFSGSYGLLDFPTAGYVSSHMLNVQAGYDYLLDPMDSIAVIASCGKTDYTGTTGSTTDYAASLAYGRKITGRLAFQLGVGPQHIRQVSPTGNLEHWSWSANSALTYERRRSGVSFSYMGGLGSGSGVFMGAKTNTFSGSGHYQFTRFWTGSLTGGYALNSSLAPAGGATTSFNNEFIGASLGRQIGRHAQVNFNYGVQEQGSPAICPVANCGVAGFQQTFGMTVNWHLRPMG